MKTTAMVSKLDQLNRALHSACMGNMGMAAAWLEQARHAINQGQDQNYFMSHAHPSNTRKALAAFRLADSEIHHCL